MARRGRMAARSSGRAGRTAPSKSRAPERDRDPPRRDRDERRASDRDSGSRRGGSKFIYKPRTFEDVKTRAEQTGGTFDSPIKQGFDMWTPKQGENNIRYLPPSWGEGQPYAYRVWMHRFVGPDKSTYVCLDKQFKKPCPICEAMRECDEAGEVDEAKELKPTDTRVSWILDRDENDFVPQIYIQGWTMNRDVEALSVDKKKGNVIYIDDPDNGYDVRFQRTGTRFNTRYFGIAIDRDPTPISDDPDEQQGVIDFIMENPIPDILQVYDYDHLDRMINGAVDSSNRDEQDEEDLPRGRAREPEDEPEDEPRGRRRSAREEEPDDEPVDAPRGRGARDEPDDDEIPFNGGRRRSARDDDDELTRTVRGRGRARDRDDDDAKEERGSRSRR